MMKVYKCIEEACGNKIIIDDPKVVLEMVELFMSESIDGSFEIEIIEMSKEELAALPEDIGC